MTVPYYTHEVLFNSLRGSVKIQTTEAGIDSTIAEGESYGYVFVSVAKLETLEELLNRLGF